MSQPAPTNQDLPRPAPAAPAVKAAGARGARPEGRGLPASAEQLRRARARKLLIRFALFAGIPTLVAVVYVAFLASPQFDSTAVIAIESSRGRDDAGDAKGGGNRHDARLLRDYIRSRAMLDALVADHGFLAHYQSGEHDWHARLDDDADQSELLDYFHDKVVVTREHDSNVLSLRVRAFAPEQAQALAAAILARAEAWIDELSTRSRDELVAPAERIVATAREHLAAARTGADPLQIEIAQEELEAALQGLQAAQLQAARDERYLIRVAEPSRPDAASRPRPAWDVATVMITSLVLTAVLSLLGAAVREHANF